jgi:lycopene cyclase domain-containing protein
LIPAPYTYLAVDFCCLIFPLLFSFHPKLQFYRQWRYFTGPCLLTALIFLLWDSLFTHLGVWQFNPVYLCGIYIGNMPLEEVLFFICIPYACVFSYFCFGKLPGLRRWDRVARVFFGLLIVALLAIALTHLQLLYTSVTFILLALFLAWLLYRRVPYLAVFLFCFLFILLPFLWSNGTLTGSFYGRTVVIYNDHYNLGIRLLTIPVEDIFYGMLLLLGNVYGFERNRTHSGKA